MAVTTNYGIAGGVLDATVHVERAREGSSRPARSSVVPGSRSRSRRSRAARRRG